MPQIALNLKSEKRTRELFSIEEFKDRFLYGIKIEKHGRPIPDSVIQNYIDFAKEQVEKMLLVKLDLQIFSETKNFKNSDYRTWGQIRLSYPIICPISIDGFIGSVRQVTYPKEWMSVKSSSDDLYSRLLHIVVTTGSAFHSTMAGYSGVYPNAGYVGGGDNTPNYWTVKYITGFKRVPKDIETAIGMLAAINILAVGNETVASALGALGASSKSISIDGLSQSVSMYMNGQSGIFGARIKQYTEMLTGDKGLMQRLQDYYGAILWTTS